jgi:hypothetical protein
MSGPLRYRVTFYRDRGAQRLAERVHTEHCHDQQQARDCAVSSLLDAYMLLIYPREEPLRDGWGRYWCELAPVRYHPNGHWEPDPAADGHTDAAYLGDNGEITLTLAASARRWQHLRGLT